MKEKLIPLIKSLSGFAFWLGVPALFVAAWIIGMTPELQPKEPQLEEMHTYSAPDMTERLAPEFAVPNDADKTEAQKVAERFIRVFHGQNPEKPTAYIDNAVEFMSDDMAMNYKGIPKRGTLEKQKITVTDVEVMPADFKDKEQIWTAYVNSDDESITGQVEHVFTEYAVRVIEIEGTWKVDGVKINER